jgi:type I restriction enzyme S subunit
VDGELSFSPLKYLPSSHSEFPELLLQPGDVLFNRTNSPELVGKSAVYKGAGAGQPEPCSFASYLIRLRPVGVPSTLLAHYINSPFGRAWVATQVVQQVGQANVNGTKLRALSVPVPQVAEQALLTERLARGLGLVARLRELTEDGATRCRTVDSAILAKAFRGELVPQHPSDEPASALLERIRTQSGKQTAKAGPSRRR